MHADCAAAERKGSTGEAIPCWSEGGSLCFLPGERAVAGAPLLMQPPAAPAALAVPAAPAALAAPGGMLAKVASAPSAPCVPTPTWCDCVKLRICFAACSRSSFAARFLASFACASSAALAAATALAAAAALAFAERAADAAFAACAGAASEPPGEPREERSGDAEGPSLATSAEGVGCSSMGSGGEGAPSGGGGTSMYRTRG